VLATVDEGRAAVTRKMADARGKGFAFIAKQRLSGTETQVRAVHGDVDGKTVLIVDDMIATGGSLVKAAQAYKERGAKAIYAVATHGVFCDPAPTVLHEAPIERIWVSDTHPGARSNDRVKVMPILAEFISRLRSDMAIDWTRYGPMVIDTVRAWRRYYDRFGPHATGPRRRSPSPPGRLGLPETGQARGWRASTGTVTRMPSPVSGNSTAPPTP